MFVDMKVFLIYFFALPGTKVFCQGYPHYNFRFKSILNVTCDQASLVYFFPQRENKEETPDRRLFWMLLTELKNDPIEFANWSRKFYFYNCRNRPFPSSLVPLFQSESKCETILMKMTLICMKMKLHAGHFHMKGFALRLVLKHRHKRVRKWSILAHSLAN